MRNIEITLNLTYSLLIMLKKNTVQFAVVREDSDIEINLFEKYSIKNPILIGSGGCTALTLASQYPGMLISLIEPNLAQINLVKSKIQILKAKSKSKRISEYAQIIESGNFEALFRSMREFIHEFIADEKDLEKLFMSGTTSQWKKVFSHPYWSVSFDLFFSTPILLTMFGPAAIQHGPPESYGRYFQNVFEKGILAKNRKDNHFLQHLLLGRYLSHSLPLFLEKPPAEVNFKYFSCMANEVKSYAKYDFVGLSNIFDWSSESEVRDIVNKLDKELDVGAIVVFRQLNNAKSFRKFFGKNFEWLDSDAQSLHEKDRSLFYSSLQIARRIK
ncbi:MAG: DUF3419 family protein [Bacillota bacterium]